MYGKLRNFNSPIGLTPDFIPFRQLGQYEDPELDGLYYNRFRYYDCETGLYVSQDPIGLEGNNPTMYGYVHDSNTGVDIFGLDTFSPIQWTAPTSGTGNNYTVYQQNIDWDRVDDKGRTNLQRASKGTAPLGNDGKSINLHHSKQNAQGPLFEVSDSMHKKYDRSNALHPYKVDGTGQHPHFPVDRDAFDTDRGAYWRHRAKAEKARRKAKLKCK
ncbi:HNH/ENDO VII family nuclease [Flavobacterium columnare]|uniref:HNH/ENDO VII family nuclease n=1 Tax=Flavobacterium columnare TaxID=996 RepID=UPI0021D1CCC0